jgi:hypothetical protein
MSVVITQYTTKKGLSDGVYLLREETTELKSIKMALDVSDPFILPRIGTMLYRDLVAK